METAVRASSIVPLRSATTYELRFELTGSKRAAENETFPISRTVQLDDLKGKTLTVDQSGTAAAILFLWSKPETAGVSLDGAEAVEQCVDVKASFVAAHRRVESKH